MPKWFHLLTPPEVRQIHEYDSIYSTGNKYGFQININHPVVAKAYAEFRKEIGEETFPISDADRFEFERRVTSGHYKQLIKYLPR